MGNLLPLPVHAVPLAEPLSGLLAPQGAADLLSGQQIVPALLPLAVRVLTAGKAAAGQAQLPQGIFQRPAGDGLIPGPLCPGVGL